ncbi:serine/threonine kinase 16 [Exophiala viscosa]|uniref:Serine/threonine kinase 16 n=1 Tax=Exophiala viscosa TaxID=2486360 RepID=A0AAN6E541_9EURO|nr:serine/threonine kinase 16 [Exophiala viscosa]KAI1627384.1 serine/threonine kinase 16 [Exophiala viscosa]
MTTAMDESLPGTLRLFDANGNPLATEGTGLKKHGDIVLVPQPSESPNDPLQWSLSRKIWHSFLVCFVTALTAATSNDAGAAEYNENIEIGVSYGSFNTGAGVLFCGIGYWTLLSSPLVYLYGRRILYLICMLFGLIGGIWLAKTQTTGDAVFNQLFVGASESVAEATVQLSLMDLWFQHQRGSVLGVYVLATSIGTYLGPLIASYIADSSLDWRWIGWFGAIFSAMTFFLFLFGLEETAFRRDKFLINGGERYLIDGVNRANSPHIDNGTQAAQREKTLEQPHQTNSALPSVELTTGAEERPKSYWERIAIITPAPNLRGTGFKQYFLRLFHTLRVFTFPAVWYSGLQWGAQDAWLTFYLTIEEDNWYGPPWNYSDAADGNMNIPCLIGAVIGCFYGGWFSDKFVSWMAKRNGGVFEAEQRLWLLFPTACIFPVGMWLFGIGTAYGWSWPAPYVGLGFIGFGWGCAGDLSMAYLMDAYPEMVLEGMVGVATINNSIALIFTFTASDWIDASGVRNCFIAIGVLAFVFLMTTLPMIIWGKKARRFTRDRYLRFLEIRDGFD